MEISLRGLGEATPNPCRIPDTDPNVTQGWSCEQWPQYPNLTFAGSWKCTDGTIYANAKYLNAANPLLHPECWSQKDRIGVGVIAAQVLLLPGWWKLIAIPTFLVLAASGIH